MRERLYWRRSILVLLALACQTGVGFPEVDRVRCNLSAQKMLDAGRFEEARQGFKSSLEEAQKAGDKDAAGTCTFYLGLATQREALASGPGGQRTDLLNQSIKWYTLAHGWNPLAPGTVVNLARAYVETGRYAEADTLLKDALSRVEEDGRAPLLHAYADLLAEQKRWQESASYYRKALNLVEPEKPANQQAWSALLDLLLEHQPRRLEQEVWRAVEEGQQTLSAQEKAFEALSRSVALPEPTRISLLTAIVAGMARQQDAPDDLRGSATGARLRRLQEDPLLGPGARQVLALHARQDLSSTSSYGWWSALDSPYFPKRSRLVVFRSLVLALAQQLALEKPEELKVAQAYLKLGELLQPQVPDPLIYAELAALYSVSGNADLLRSDLGHWTRVLESSSENRPAGAPALDPRDLLLYHLRVASALEQLGIHARRGDPAAIEYHLARAKAEGERAKDGRLLLAVGAAERHHGLIQAARNTYEIVRDLPADLDTKPAREEAEARLADLPPGGGGGGGSGGGGRWATLNPWTGVCMGFPEMPCRAFYVERRDLVPLSSDRWAAGPVRRIEGGCVARKEAGDEPKAQPLFASLRSSASQSSALALQTCRRVTLDPQPAWPTSGIWNDGSLLAADSLHARLLRYDLDGALRQVLPDPSSESERTFRVTQVLAFPQGAPAIYEEGRLIWLDKGQAQARQVELIGRQGAQGTLRAVYQLTLTSPDEAYAVGDVERDDGSWIRGVLRIPLRAGADLEMVHRIASLDPKLDLYRLGNPFLASVGGRAYFLDLRQPVFLNVLPGRGGPKRRLAAIPSGTYPKARRGSELAEPEATTALYQALETSRLPAGLYGFRSSLYLLTRRPEQDGKTSWTLSQIDPRSGRQIRSVELPTSASHLTVVPGERHWALIEKGPVESWGRQTIPTAVFVPTAWIDGFGAQALPECALDPGAGLVAKARD